MIHLITGLPGASKTLNTIAYIDSNPDFANRPIYYIRIKELTLPWIELTEDGVRDWQSLPDGAIVVIDEGQYIFPTRDPKKSLPEFILALSEHRHRGFDFFVITQSPMILDAGFRRFVGKHTHYERVFGLLSAKRFEWEKCQSDVDDFFIRKSAVVTRVPFNKKYYGVYKSAEIHTVKRKIPFKVFAPFLLLSLIIGAGWYHFHDRFSPPAAVDAVKEKVKDSTDSEHLGLNTLNGSKSKKYLTLAEYVDLHTPRIADIPSSAPVYDELTKPKTFPKPQCIRAETTSNCQCYTQQATKLNISQSVCNSIVDNGYFDDTKPDMPEPKAESAGSSVAPRSAGGSFTSL